MLQANLRDAALAAAKAWSHEQADRRHVGYAIASHFRDRPDMAELLPRAKRALEPRGAALDPPTLTDAAAALLDSIRSEEDALAIAREILADEAPSSETGVARETDEVAAAAEEDPEESPEATGVTETVAEVLADLDRLIGLEAVKEQVRRLIAVVQANRERANAGLPTVNPGLHLVFTGPPGTGKTTVARVIARLYAASGALPGAKFTEVSRSDLVAGYVGQTAMKTAEAIKRTLPGTLFIDEAYSLTPSHASDYGAEAIATIVKAMEDHRHELAVIVAGYGEEMAEFLASNPGLRSRLKTFIDFPDYAPEELVQIFAGFANATGLGLAEGALEKAEDLFERASNSAHFGNARFARSLFEQAYSRMALRAAADGEVEMNELLELAPEDLEWMESGVEAKTRRIGFEHRDEGEGDNEAP